MNFMKNTFEVLRKICVTLYEFKGVLSYLLRMFAIVFASFLFVRVSPALSTASTQLISELNNISESPEPTILFTSLFSATLLIVTIVNLIHCVYRLCLYDTAVFRLLLATTLRVSILLLSMGLLEVPVIKSLLNEPSNNAIAFLIMIVSAYAFSPYMGRGNSYAERHSIVGFKESIFDRDTSKVVAIHEAGHFVVYTQLTQGNVINTTQLVAMEDSGRMYNEGLPKLPFHQQIMVLLAGEAAEQLHHKFTPSSTTPFKQSSDYKAAYAILQNEGYSRTATISTLNELYSATTILLVENSRILLRVAEEVEKKRIMFSDELIDCIKGA